jgi:hypothetical protein
MERIGSGGSAAGCARRWQGGNGRIPCVRVRSAPRAIHPAAAHQGGLLAGLAPGRHVGGWVPSCWHGAPSDRCRRDAQSADAGLVCFAVPTSQVELVWKPVQARHRLLHLSPPMCEEATVRWLPVWRQDTMAADAGGSRLLSMVATLGACGSTRSRGCRCATVVRLSDVVRDAQLRGDALDAHQPAEERHAAAQRKGHYPRSAARVTRSWMWCLLRR